MSTVILLCFFFKLRFVHLVTFCKTFQKVLQFHIALCWAPLDVILLLSHLYLVLPNPFRHPCNCCILFDWLSPLSLPCLFGHVSVLVASVFWSREPEVTCVLLWMPSVVEDLYRGGCFNGFFPEHAYSYSSTGDWFADRVLSLSYSCQLLDGLLLVKWRIDNFVVQLFVILQWHWWLSLVTEVALRSG